MKRSKAPLHGLYAIADSALLGSRLTTAADACLQGGCRLIQYRDKSATASERRRRATELLHACRGYNALLIINDDVELARAIGADGVHLGQDDATADEARKLLGKNAVIGVSCYNRPELAAAAEQAGADYVAFGSVFASPTKPDAVHAPPELISRAKQNLNIPVCAIGGITTSNAQSLVDAGVDMIAVISAIFNGPDVENKTRQFVTLFGNP